MDNLLELWGKPDAQETYMIAGWRQWADAGAVSSGLPQYLVDLTRARRIGQIASGGFYLFQIPGTHHLVRPEIKLREGYRREMETRKNEFFYADVGNKGLVLFLGEEPHLNEERYAAAFLDAVQALGVRRVATVGGVYGTVPYDKDRDVSCVYSLRRMKKELAKYAVRFSGYEGGVTIGAYLAHQAERRGVEMVVFNAFVPAYDFSELTAGPHGLRVDDDYRAWYELMRRFNHMFGLELDLDDLEHHSEEVAASLEAQLAEVAREIPTFDMGAYMLEVANQFTERPFMPLDDLWERELRDLLEDDDLEA